MAERQQVLVAGVDSSTQATKVVVCNAATGEVVREARAGHPDGTEVHPDRWWEAFEKSTADGLLEGVQALGVGGQQHGMVALDQDGEVVRPALPDMTDVFIDPDPTNERAIRCYRAVGFVPTGDLLADPEHPGGQRLLMRLDSP